MKIKPNPLISMIGFVYGVTVAASHLGKWWVAGVGVALAVSMTVLLWLDVHR